MWLSAPNKHHSSAQHQIRISDTIKSNQPTVFEHRILSAFVLSIRASIYILFSYIFRTARYGRPVPRRKLLSKA